MEKKDFILASASPHRLALLEQIGYAPKMVAPADIDESVKKEKILLLMLNVWLWKKLLSLHH